MCVQLATDGTLEWTQFVRCLHRLERVSRDVHDNWSRAQHSDDVGGVYLTKTEFRTLPVNAEESTSECVDTTCFNVDPQEAGVLSPLIAKFEYHIVYSISYSVPVLYFTVTKTDGSLVQIEDIWKWIPKFYLSETTSDATNDISILYQKYGSMLTQMEHPILMRPFYAIHPCHTSTLMKNIFVGKHCDQNKLPLNADNYLISWLSSIAPIAALHMKPEYGTRLND